MDRRNFITGAVLSGINAASAVVNSAAGNAQAARGDTERANFSYGIAATNVAVGVVAAAALINKDDDQ